MTNPRKSHEKAFLPVEEDAYVKPPAEVHTDPKPAGKPAGKHFEPLAEKKKSTSNNYLRFRKIWAASPETSGLGTSMRSAMWSYMKQTDPTTKKVRWDEWSEVALEKYNIGKQDALKKTLDELTPPEITKFFLGAPSHATMVAELNKRSNYDMIEAKKNQIRDQTTDATRVPDGPDMTNEDDRRGNPFVEPVKRAINDGPAGPGGGGGGFNPSKNVGGNGFQSAPGAEQLGRGAGIYNAGGGRVDTRLGVDADGNDEIISGAQTVNVARGTLRSRFEIAAGKDVEPTKEEKQITAAGHEKFDWVLPGEGRDPNNPLVKLETQHDMIRFGGQDLSTRSYEFEHQPHEILPQFYAHREPDQLKDELTEMVRGKTLVQQGLSRKRPLEDVFDEDVFYCGEKSTKGLPLPEQTSNFLDINDTLLNFLPIGHEAGFRSKKQFKRSIENQWRY